MKTTDQINNIKDRQPYGTINLFLAQQLYKKNDCSALMLHLYIGARRNLKDSRWEFNIPDISMQTGVDRRVLAKHIKRLQSEALFIPAGPTSKGASKFTLNQQEYDRRYVNVQEEPCASNVHLDQPLCASDAYTSNAQGSAVCASNVHQDVHPMHTPCASDVHTDVHPVQGGCASDVHQDVHPMYTKNKDKEAREQSRQKERKEEANSCLPSSLPASRLSEVITKSVSPFSQPMFVEDPDRPAPRNDDGFSTLTQHNKSERAKGSEASPSQEAAQLSEQVKSGKRTVSAASSFLKDTKLTDDAKPYNYTIDGTTHEIFFDEQESNAALSPIEKVTVLKHSLTPLITTGQVDVPRASVLQVTGKSFERARQLFEVNPSLPVSSLLKVAWECNRVACENPVKESGFKPCFTHRAATESLTYLLKNLDMINGTIPEDLRLPDNTVFLTVE